LVASPELGVGEALQLVQGRPDLPRTEFASRRSLVRSRYAPSKKDLLGGAFRSPAGHRTPLRSAFALPELARKSICGNSRLGLETGKTGECKCCDGDCSDRDHGSNEPHFPRSPHPKPQEQQDRTDHDCELERRRYDIRDAHGLRLTGPWSDRQPGRSGNDPSYCDERVAESSNYVDGACGIAHDRDRPAQLSQSYGHEEHPEGPVLREVLIDDGEVNGRGTRRRDRDREAKRLRGLGGTTCADADRNERDSDDRNGKGRESFASVEHVLLFLAFMVGDPGGVLVVASSGLPVMLGRNGQGAESGRGCGQEESKRKEETVRTDQQERGFGDW
jgi:hypothetical protein